ncbi:MAG: formate/nitrite family transporter [Anaerolineae bacterium]|nr:formate/nitrite family transporter [Anaerolineae bacterium]
MESQLKIDALVPTEMAYRAEYVGAAKAEMPALSMFTLAVLAGAFISLGAVFATTVTAGDGLPYGVGRLLSGLTFCLGLILVVVAGAELFTGNNLIVMAWAAGRVSTRALLRNWIIVYLGNLVGALGTVALVFWSGQYRFGPAGGEVGRTALKIAAAKCDLGFGQAIALGIMCNALVCLAVWLTFSARTTTDKIVAIIFPITAFVAAGFEHSVANMYFIARGLVIQEFDASWVAAHAADLNLSGLTMRGFLLDNLLPVTIGNIIGGGVLVALVYWFIYLRPRGRGG